MIASSDGIILSCKKYGDTSRIVTIFTEEYGIIKAIAKGSRNPKSKLNAALAPLNICEISFYMKKNSDLHLLSNAEKKYSLNNLLNNFENLNYGLMAAESLIKILEIYSKHSELFFDTINTMNHLNDISIPPFSVFLKHQFLLAKDLGFDFDFCVESEFNNIYNIEQGSFFKTNMEFAKNSHKFEINTIKNLNIVYNSDFCELSGIIFSAEESLSIIEFLSKYFSFHLEKSFYYSSYKLLK